MGTSGCGPYSNGHTSQAERNMRVRLLLQFPVWLKSEEPLTIPVWNTSPAHARGSAELKLAPLYPRLPLRKRK